MSRSTDCLHNSRCHPLMPGSWILALGKTGLHIGHIFRPHTASWKRLSLSWHHNWVLQRPQHCSIKPADSGGWKQGISGKLNEHRAFAKLHLLFKKWSLLLWSEAVLLEIPRWLARRSVSPRWQSSQWHLCKTGKFILRMSVTQTQCWPCRDRLGSM